MKYLKTLQNLLLLVILMINYYFFKNSIFGLISSFSAFGCTLINLYIEFKNKKKL